MGRVLVVLVVVLAMAAGPASAATRVASAGYIDGDVALAGPAVVYEEHVLDAPVEDLHRLWVTRPGRERRLLASEAPKSALRYAWSYVDLWFAATTKHVAVGRDEWGEENSLGGVEETVYTRRQLRALPLGGRGQGWKRAACTTPGDASATYRVEASDDALVTAASMCEDKGIEVRRLSGDGHVLRAIPEASGRLPFDIAGPYVAYLTRAEELVVADWRTGRQLYSTPTERDRNNFTWSNFPSLQRDGTVVLVSGGAYHCKRKLIVLSPAAPQARELPVTACDGGVQLAGGRIAFFRKLGPGTELVTVNLDGGDVRPLARFGEDAATGLDFDGRRVAWNTWRCADSIVSIDEWDSGRVAPAPPVDCPAIVRGRSFEVSDRGRVRIPIRCPQGCNVGGGSLEPEHGYEVDALNYPGRQRGDTHLDFQLEEKARRHLSRRGSLKAKLDWVYLRPGVREKYRDLAITLRRG